MSVTARPGRSAGGTIARRFRLGKPAPDGAAVAPERRLNGPFIGPGLGLRRASDPGRDEEDQGMTRAITPARLRALAAATALIGLTACGELTGLAVVGAGVASLSAT